jgi:phage/plasmid-like protein (TIGR03299 family)
MKMVDAVTRRKDGTHEHAYVGEVGWHGLGNQLEAGMSIETWIQAAGMDWNVNRGSLSFLNEAGKSVPIDGLKALHRSDNNMLLGTVSDAYKVVQPKEVLEFFRDLSDNNGFSLDTAGTLFGGKRFWALASIGEEACVIGNDNIKGYLLLATSADGSLATTAQFTTVRVVCNNTLSAALSTKGSGRVSVSHRSIFKPDTVKTDLGIVRGQFKDFMVQARQLAKAKVGVEKASLFVGQILTDTKTIASQDAPSTRAHKAIMALFEGEGKGADMKGVAGTAWGVVNAITEYVDHHARSQTEQHRLSEAFFGRGDQLKALAFARAAELV